MDYSNFDISKFRGIGKLIYDGLKQNPNVVGQINANSGEKYSFETMLDKSVRCAIWLQKQGIKKGDIVAVCTDIHMDDFVPFLACLYIEAFCSPWNYEDDTKNIENCIQSATPKVIFTINQCIDTIVTATKKLSTDAKIISFEEHPDLENLKTILEKQKTHEVDSFEISEVEDPNETVGLCYSSGTTSSPKPIEISHSMYFYNIASLGSIMPKYSISLWYSKLSWITGEFFILGSIMRCATRVVHSNPDEEETLGVIDKFQVSWACVFSTFLGIIYYHKTLDKYDLSSLKTLFCTGNSISGKLLKAISAKLEQAHVFQAYGTTEAGGFLTLHLKRSEKFDSCGVVVPHAKIEIVDRESGQVLPAQQLGEIRIRSPCLTNGYYKLPSLTKELVDDCGRLHTGDLGYFDQDNYIYITDRIKSLIRYRTSDVTVGELENLLESHSGVAAAAVLGVPHDFDGHHPMAFIERIPGSKVTEEELTNLSATLGDINYLRAGVKFLDKMPRTSNKKIKRATLKEMIQQQMINETVN